MKPVTGWFNVPLQGETRLLCTSAPPALQPAAQGVLQALLEQLSGPLPKGTVRVEVHGLPPQPSVEVVCLAGPDRHVVLVEYANNGPHGVAVLGVAVSLAHGKPAPTPSRLLTVQQDAGVNVARRVVAGDSLTVEVIIQG